MEISPIGASELTCRVPPTRTHATGHAVPARRQSLLLLSLAVLPQSPHATSFYRWPHPALLHIDIVKDQQLHN